MEGQRCSRSLATVLTLFLAIAGSLGGVPPAASATPAQTGTPRLQTGFGSLPLTFEPNRGQAGSEVRFLARTAGSLVFLTATSIMLETAAGTGKLGRASLRFVGANSHAAVAGIHRLPGRVNYFLGNNPSRWMTDIPTYAGIKELGVYRGIDAVFHGAGATGLEYRWILHPGARVSSIRLRLRSDLQAHLSASGDLCIGSGRVTVVQQRPFAFQDAGHARITIPASYTRLPGHVIGLRLGRYDHAFPLVIDPTLIYSTYLGGFDSDGASDIAVDANGSAYITGDTLSTGFPVSHALHGSNTSQPICRLDGSQACADAFVAKLSPAGTALIYSTYLGGTLDDYGHAIAVDKHGNAYIAGSTLSGDFPLAHPLQSRFGGGTNLGDAFVTELNASGDRLVYSTYLGGSREDDAEAIALLGGNAYIAGRTDSSNFRTASPLQAFLGGGTCHYDFIQTGTAACFDAFVARIGRSGISLRFSTYLGGNGSDFAFGIAVHGGNVYVAGQTDSTNLKAHSVDTRAGIQSSLRTGTCSPDGAARRCSDAFVSEIAGSGKRVIYNTYLGGNGEDYANALAVDRAGNAYVVGDTQSSNFPLVAPFRSKFTGGPDMAFVAKVASGGGKLVYSTYLGGSDGDEAYGVAVDRAGDAFVTGRTSSPNFPVSNPVQRTIRTVAGDPPQNAFLTELNPSGNGLVYSTFLGGSNHDSGNGIALDAAGNAYLTGFASSTNFPVIHPIQSSLRGGVYDAMVAKIGNPNAVLPSHRTTEKPCKTGFERVHGTCARGQRKGA